MDIQRPDNSSGDVGATEKVDVSELSDEEVAERFDEVVAHLNDEQPPPKTPQQCLPGRSSASGQSAINERPV